MKGLRRYKIWGFYFMLIVAEIGCRDQESRKSLGDISKYEDSSFRLVLKDKFKAGKRIKLIGEDSVTNYTDTGAYLYDRYALFENGDTVMKDKGTLYMKILKKDKVYLVNIGYGYSKLDSVLLIK